MDTIPPDFQDSFFSSIYHVNILGESHEKKQSNFNLNVQIIHEQNKHPDVEFDICEFERIGCWSIKFTY